MGVAAAGKTIPPDWLGLEAIVTAETYVIAGLGRWSPSRLQVRDAERPHCEDGQPVVRLQSGQGCVVSPLHLSLGSWRNQLRQLARIGPERLCS